MDTKFPLFFTYGIVKRDSDDIYRFRQVGTVSAQVPPPPCSLGEVLLPEVLLL